MVRGGCGLKGGARGEGVVMDGRGRGEIGGSWEG